MARAFRLAFELEFQVIQRLVQVAIPLRNFAAQRSICEEQTFIALVTPLAGFAETGPALATWAGSDGAGSVVTSLAGFAGEARPHAPGGRSAIPASLK